MPPKLNINPEQLQKLGPYLLAGTFAFYGLRDCVYRVQSGERAIKFNILTGLSPVHYMEGYHLKIPFIEKPIIYGCRAKTFDIAASTPNRDLQTVELKARVIYKPNPEKLHEIHANLGYEYVQKVLTSLFNEVVRGVVAQYTAQQLYNQREMISESMKKNLTERCQPFNIIIDDLSLMDLHFSKFFEQAVEEKQIAQQSAERAKFTVEKAIQEKKSAIIVAEASAQSFALIGERIKQNPAYLQTQRIDTAVRISAILAHSKNRILLTSDSLMVNVNDEKFSTGMEKVVYA